MGRVVLVIALAALIVVCAAKPTVMGLQKLDPRRWVKRSNERRAKRGLPAWSAKAWRGGNNNTLPAGGDVWPVAIYWSFVNIGSPSKKFPVAIDSGSFTLDVPLVGCDGCVHQPPNNQYNPATSSSSVDFTCSLFSACIPYGAECKKKKCTFSNTYETCVPTDPTEPCTIDGLWYQDQVSWGDSGAVPVQFGAINYQTSNFEQFQNINGVVGMAGPSNPQSVIGQLSSNNAIQAYEWSICLKPGSVSNGSITVGGIDDRLYTGSIAYTPNTGGGQFYQMGAQGITVGGASVVLDEPNVIIDSGTNILLLPSESYTSLKQVFLALCSSVNLHGVCDVPSGSTIFDNVCYPFTPAQVAAFPNITLSVPNINLVLTPAHYILYEYGVNFKPGQSCLGVSPTGPGGLFIIGDTLMSRYLVVFDQTNQRIGWAPVSNKCGSIA